MITAAIVLAILAASGWAVVRSYRWLVYATREPCFCKQNYVYFPHLVCEDCRQRKRDVVDRNRRNRDLRSRPKD